MQSQEIEQMMLVVRIQEKTRKSQLLSQETVNEQALSASKNQVPW